MDEVKEKIWNCPWCKNAIDTNGRRLIGCEECQDFFCDDDCRVCFHIANVLAHQKDYTPNKRLQKVRNIGTELALRITEAKQQQHMSPGLSMTADNACQLLDDLGEIVKQSIAREACLSQALEWYAERARSLAEKDWKNNPSYAEAIFVELALDGGRRAASVEGKK